MSAIAQDLLIIGAYFAIIVGIGVHFSRRNKNVAEFALGGRSIPWWAVLASILAAEISAGTFFGTPGEGFRMRNLHLRQLMIGLPAGPRDRQRGVHSGLLQARRRQHLRVSRKRASGPRTRPVRQRWCSC